MKYLSSKIMFITLLYLICISCKFNDNDQVLHQALQLAGDYRTELEKVLRHYENDSLKLEAAKFLI